MSEKPHSSTSKITYKDAGVDIENADKTVDWMKSNLTASPDSPHRTKVLSGVGGFSALFDGSFQNYKNPVLVSSTDGIGTKLLMGLESGLLKGLPQDLVGMCANDLLCVGAEPLFFLDYFASSKLDSEALKDFFTNLKQACFESHLALIGGETAELPGLYAHGHFDAAGFCVGVVDKDKIWSPEKVQKDDRCLFIESSGFHSNGYSLLRKIFGEDGGEYKKELMTPTKLYWPLVKALRETEAVKSCAHITGGGLDNILRALPEGLGLRVKDWQWKAIFTEAKKKSGLSKEEMLKTFNCGVGLSLIVAKDSLDSVKIICENTGFKVVTEGEVFSSEIKKWELHS